ncbi:TonB-dependent receptor [Chitinophaga tropicalis]|uniref:SusC/RagA family TonB-linked outer membrane protein n=1 Tax=Chitinophaga tropicalis TaxID=2683588 RepID=A0A7K1U092_9BACT|nr:TonB-dependent receptor [Chitinophaga tropicalis]MVT07787.1 SusC/RagA family TonB-linked outer membrane protein [Chitinophaga tropicalis]
MKLTVFLLTVIFLQANATGYAQKLSLSLKDRPLEDAFREIKKKTGYTFFYKLQMLEDARNVNLQVENTDLEKVLDIIFKDQPLTYELVNKTVVVKAKKHGSGALMVVQPEAAPALVISGKVTDDKGSPLPGVSVQVKGTSKGTQTNGNGEYTLNGVDDKAVLVFSYIGFQTKEIPVEGRSNIAIALQTGALGLSDVVVVGYGSQSRKELTSSVTSVKSEDLNRGPINDPAQLLQGKVPGLNVTNSGDPNKTSTMILRGASTLRTGAAQQPFYVVDGVPGVDISLIAPDDIASIDVLKDAAATSIYGTRASNGVIMVTTKRAKKGTTQLSYSGYVGFEKVANKLKMMNGAQIRDFVSKNGLAFDPVDDQNGNTDWQKEVERNTGISHNHNVSVSGGTDKTVYNVSLNYFKKQGIIKGTQSERINGRLYLEQKAFDDNLKLGFSLSNSVTNSDNIPNLQVTELTTASNSPENTNKGYLLENMVKYLPTVPVYQADGSLTENFKREKYFNPVGLQTNAFSKLQTKAVVANVTAELKLPFGFKYNLSLAWQNIQRNQGTYYNSYYTTNYGSLLPVGAVNGLAYRSSYQNTNTIAENYLTYDKKLGQHSITALIGYSFQEDGNGDGFQSNNYNFPSDALGYYGIGLGSNGANFRTDWGNTYYTKLRLISDYARLNYNYAGKYFLQATVRRDGSSAFGTQNQWGYFPSVSAAWNITEEGFMKGQGIADELKLRGGYGVTGNSLGFDPFISRLQYGTAGYFNNAGAWVTAIGPTQNANPDLKWEKTAMSNIGLDYSLLNGMITGTIDVYKKKTSDLIWNYPVPTTQYPVGTLTANAGVMVNKGIEVTINVTPVKSKDFSWTSSLNLAHNKNLIESMSNERFKLDSIPLMQPDGGGQTGATLQLIKSGHPIGQFFTFKYAGKTADGISQFYNAKGEATSNVSSLVNGRDYYYAGNAQPKLLLGWNNSFTYKQLSFNFFFRSTLGNQIFNATQADLNRPATAAINNLPVSSANESAKDVNAYRYSSRFIEKGDYLRLDNATVAYTFKNISKNFRSLRLYVSGNNLFTITGYKGIDPEVNLGGLTPGVDANNFYPKTRTVLVGLNATF